MDIKKLGNLEVRIFNDYEEVSRQAAEIFAAESKKTLKTKEIFTVSLCGGSTPKRLFELLAGDFRNEISWDKVHIFFGDERAEKNNPESNFQITEQILLKRIKEEFPPFNNNIHRIKMELGLIEGVKDYEKEINEFAPNGFDLAINGVGSDGHRNGVFPDSENWKNKIWDLPESVRVFGYEVPPEINPYKKRITLTPWFLNKSKTNILMISGREKAELLKKITIDKEKYQKRELPAITFNEAPTIVLTEFSTLWTQKK